MTEPAHIVQLLRAKSVGDPPSPWRVVRRYIAGVTAVGFAPRTDLLLVLSHSGRGVLDPVTGDVLARSDDTDFEDDPYPVSAPGIGPLEGQRIAVAGLWGGGLPAFTPDGWWVSVVAPDWPDEGVVLVPPGRAGPVGGPDRLAARGRGRLRAGPGRRVLGHRPDARGRDHPAARLDPPRPRRHRVSRRRSLYPVLVDLGGSEVVPQLLLGPPPRVRAWCVWTDRPLVITTLAWRRSRSSMDTAVVCSGRKRPGTGSGLRPK